MALVLSNLIQFCSFIDVNILKAILIEIVIIIDKKTGIFNFKIIIII